VTLSAPRRLDGSLPPLPPYLAHVLDCLMCGLDNSDITKELGISACTLKGYRSELIERFEVRTITQVVAKAGRLGAFGSRPYLKE
jgi:DNA-binding NarL/FixJ family response regulator